MANHDNSIMPSKISKIIGLDEPHRQFIIQVLIYKDENLYSIAAHCFGSTFYF
jgi:hypothetical protein